MSHYDDSIGGGNTRAPNSAAQTQPLPDNLVNQVLDGRYVIERRLGHGGFGAVYLATDTKMSSRKIVVKILHEEELTNDWSKKKFQQELEALARIDHPSVVGVLDSGETPDARPYIVMQYIDGVTLRSLLTPEGMPFWRVANIARQVGRALTAAHQAGILHRDLKPENIMVEANEDEDYLKVIDFGVAKVRDSIIDVTTAKDVAVGTIAYMSPEQLNAKPLTPGSDIYTLGVIAYEMLTGRRPTNPESAFQLLELQRSGIRIKPSDLRPGLPQEAETVLLKALSFDPNDRYERARDFGDLLSSALLGNNEQTLLTTRSDGKPGSSEDPSLETAHVLFIDIVGYSRLLIGEQKEQLQQLQRFVSATNECGRAKASDQLIALPTGDGMALVFFNDPEAPVKCAVEISHALKATPKIQLRMGVHSGLVYRMEDIKNNMNVAGGGINIAQRVMDCGDQGHILLSKRVADDLGQLARWSPYLHDLGAAEVKHGVIVQVFSLFGDDFGNAESPTKFQKKTNKTGESRKVGLMMAAVVLVIGLAVGLIWRSTHQTRSESTTGTTPPITNPAPTGPARSLSYWLTYQKVRDGKPDSDIRQSAGNDIFGNGWRFQFNLTPNESGALYLLNVGPGKQRAEEYNILFPLPGAGQSNPNLRANQQFKSDWADFVDRNGVERIWIIWSVQPIPELDTIFKHAVQNKKEPGVVSDNEEIDRIQVYLNMRDPVNLKVIHNKEKKQTSIDGHGDILVELVELTHEAN